MRIVYTNLKEDDAGVKRSVRQFRVEFNGTGTPAALEARLTEPAAVADERSGADRRQRVRTPEAAHAVHGPQATPPQITPPVAGMCGFRSIFIKKFTDTQTGLLDGKKGHVSITV